MSNAETNDVKSSGQVHCDVCDVKVSSPGLFQTHIKGKKHQQLVKLREEQERASKLGVYVTGFKCCETSEDEMSAFFSEYGAVKKIYFDKNKGLFAIVEFEHEDSVAAILGVKEPVVFKEKVLRIKKRTFPSHKPNPEKREETANINVKKRKKKHSETLSCMLSNEVINKMNQSSTVSEQMEHLINELKLTSEDLHLRSLICNILKEVFQEFVSSCEVVLFGSSANGLGCKGSDLDITLLIDTNMELWNIDLEDFTSKDDNKEPKKSNVSKDVHCFVVKVLRTLVPGCSNVIPIFTAKCPVIKFTHQTTSISCDLTINNRLGLHNTALLKCYMELDPRVSQLVYTVRTWAKAIGISGGGSGQLTSYALTVMVLHFLQTTDPPVIPSLQDVSGWPMRDNTKIIIEQELVDGWECGFYKDVCNLVPSSNIKPVETLLEEFFDFYGSKFDYGNCAVTIRKGGHFLISSLEQELQKTCASKLVDENKNAEGNMEDTVKTKELGTEWKTTPLCVQDPLELSHNLTQNVGVSSLRDIIQYMIDGRNICQRLSTNGQMNLSGTDRGIVQLFKYEPRTVSKKHKKDGYSFTVCLTNKQHSTSNPGIIMSNFSSVKGFFESLCRYLENELNVECTLSSDKQAEDSYSAVCTANTNTWTHSRRERRKALKHDDSNTTIEEVTNEANSSAATDKVSAGGSKIVNIPCLVFRLMVNKCSVVKGDECIIKLEHLGGQGLQTFENFYAYFKKQVAIVFN